MTAAELIAMIRDVNAQYAVLFSQIITINFGMIIAIHYFLHRSRRSMKFAAFVFYVVGMATFTGLLLQQANYKAIALAALARFPANTRSVEVQAVLDLNHGWLVTSSALFLNGSLWLLVAVIGWMLFRWSGEAPSGPPVAAAD